jgi:hypothetical protein
VQLFYNPWKRCVTNKLVAFWLPVRVEYRRFL